MRIIYTLILLCCVLTATAQADKWTGTWRMEYKPWPNDPIRIDLQIGAPERQTLYPAKLTLIYGEFRGVYEVLLAKKNDGQLGIGRGKFPIKETPFRLGTWMLYLNGTFDYTKKGLSLQRMWIKDFGLFMKGLYDDDEIYEQSKATLRDCLYHDSITLKKINNTPWTDPHTHRILHPENDSIYYGIYDKITVADSLLHVFIRDEDAIDRDTVSLLVNGKVLLNRVFIGSEEKELTIPIDTGMNIVTFFADNLGRLPPNTGAFRVKSDSGYYTYDFSHRANAYATFLVGQFYRVPKLPVSSISTIPPASPVLKLQEDPRITLRKNSLVDQLTVASPQAELELWDDAAEDGDTVSIRLNDRVVVTGFPVLKQRQKLSVTLDSGVNRLVLIADNLGSIPPNTAVMKITAGNTKKYVRIKTDLKQNNLLLIDYHPPAP
jgi:hypothetical protein